MTHAADFDELAQRCYSAIQKRFPINVRAQAVHRLKGELNFLQQQGITRILRDVRELVENLTSRCIPSRLIGSGCVSLVNCGLQHCEDCGALRQFITDDDDDEWTELTRLLEDESESK